MPGPNAKTCPNCNYYPGSDKYHGYCSWDCHDCHDHHADSDEGASAAASVPA